MAAESIEWRALIRAEADRLLSELTILDPDPGDATAGAIRDAIERAVAAAAPPEGGRWSRFRQRRRQWWSGGALETAWRSLHQAQEQLLLLQDNADIRAMAPEVYAALLANLSRHDGRLRPYRKELNKIHKSGTTAASAPALRTMWKAAHDASDTAHSDIRNYRNLLVWMTVLLTLAVAAVDVTQWRNPGLLPVCGKTTNPVAEGEPGVTTTTSTALPEEQRCPTGGQKSRTNDLFAIEVLGVFGAMLAAYVTLSRQRRFSGPYGLPLIQILLKVPSGAATALVGIMLLQNEIVDTSLPKGGGVILLWAIVFGYSQQTVTRLVDARATSLLGTAASKNAATETGSPPVPDDLDDD